MGRPRKITPETLEGLLDWLLENNDDKAFLYLDEMIVFLDEKYEISISKSTISRTLLKNNITKKAVSTVSFLIV